MQNYTIFQFQNRDLFSTSYKVIKFTRLNAPFDVSRKGDKKGTTFYLLPFTFYLDHANVIYYPKQKGACECDQQNTLKFY